MPWQEFVPYVAAPVALYLVVKLVSSFFSSDTPATISTLGKYSDYCRFNYNHSGKLLSFMVSNPEKYKLNTGAVALDCEMVGMGPRGSIQTLARVSVVNESGYCLFDTFVKPDGIVTDYRTHWSGIRESDLYNAPSASYAIKKVSELIRSRILIGHDISKDLAVLGIIHPQRNIRDTAEFFRNLLGRQQLPSLKYLAKEYFEITIQDGQHNSIEDAQMAMALYRLKWQPYE